MAEFKKGQIVVVNSPEGDDRQWHLRIYESKIARDIHKTYNPDQEDYDTWSLCFPAEEVWPNIFLGRERRAGEQAADAVAMESALVQKLRKQIAWLCQELNHSDDLCPTISMFAPCDHNCAKCWEEASLKAVKEEQC